MKNIAWCCDGKLIRDYESGCGPIPSVRRSKPYFFNKINVEIDIGNATVLIINSENFIVTYDVVLIAVRPMIVADCKTVFSPVIDASGSLLMAAVPLKTTVSPSLPVTLAT